MTTPAGWALHTRQSLDDVNAHFARLQSAGLLGIAETDGAATLYFPERVEGLGVDGRWEELEDRDWNSDWKAGINPVTVGSVTVVAPWHDVPGDGGTVLVIEPAQAFGTGHHETTTRCLAALQHLGVDGRSVLDVGTGTGILAIAAAALGADPVLGVDTDPLAVAAARTNAGANGVAVAVAEGTVEVTGSRRFDVVVANLDTDTLRRGAGALAARLAPGGTLVASGVSNERSGEAAAALEGAGLQVEASPGAEWALLTASRPD